MGLTDECDRHGITVGAEDAVRPVGCDLDIDARFAIELVMEHWLGSLTPITVNQTSGRDVSRTESAGQRRSALATDARLPPG